MLKAACDFFWFFSFEWVLPLSSSSSSSIVYCFPFTCFIWPVPHHIVIFGRLTVSYVRRTENHRTTMAAAAAASSSSLAYNKYPYETYALNDHFQQPKIASCPIICSPLRISLSLLDIQNIAIAYGQFLSETFSFAFFFILRCIFSLSYGRAASSFAEASKWTYIHMCVCMRYQWFTWSVVTHFSYYYYEWSQNFSSFCFFLSLILLTTIEIESFVCVRCWRVSREHQTHENWKWKIRGKRAVYRAAGGSQN